VIARPTVALEAPRSATPPRAVLGVFAGHQHACAIMDDHGVYCWGRNDRGQCGQPDRRRTTCSGRETVECVPYEGDEHRTWKPARVDALGAARSLALGESVSCATAEDGSVRCWGYHGEGRGEGSYAQREEHMRAVRVVQGMAASRHLHAGQRGACAVSDTGDVRCWNAGSLEPETQRAFRSAREVIEGTYQLCAWVADNALQCNDIAMELSRGGTQHARFTASGPAGGWAARHSAREVCAWTARGRVECGGDSGGYAHGNVRLREVEGLRDVVQVVGGESHYCARTRDGAVWCWGSNGNGQLGDGTTIERNVPVRVERLPEVVGLTAGAAFNCALARDGRVLCWGANEWGQLGGEDRRERDRRDPSPVLW
jgi:alpha-tubulin suppressor-like RCC1 family protein